jgi:hypothetical protein
VLVVAVEARWKKKHAKKKKQAKKEKVRSRDRR